jgi:hypothetical protein
MTSPGWIKDTDANAGTAARALRRAVMAAGWPLR